MNPADASLFTDLYELTMMQGYWEHAVADTRTTFELFFRRIPEEGGYCIASGINTAVALVRDMHFGETELEYLSSLRLFREDFIAFLRGLRFKGNIWSVADGTLVFPQEPFVVVESTLLEGQWIETLLLNLINFHTLIATKASRCVTTARPAEVVEFGMRRAQGPNGAMSATLAAFIGGFHGTSNVLAGRQAGIPVVGTHAHSWVMSFPSELDAFRAYAKSYPDHCVLLIDTYDTLRQGLPNAIRVGLELLENGHRLRAIRLDSGDLAYLSKVCRKHLDDAGLPFVKILASGDLDEYVIQELKIQGAAIDTFGIGTRLVTSYTEPALGGVYKIVELVRNGHIERKMKISSNPAKSTIPARKQIWRSSVDGEYRGDVLAMIEEDPPTSMTHPTFEYMKKSIDPATLVPLLSPRLRDGQMVAAHESITDVRARVRGELTSLPIEHQRLSKPHIYPVGLSEKLFELSRRMTASLSQHRDRPEETGTL